MGFGIEIKRLRNDSNISAKKLADLIGIDSERLRKWESNDFEPRMEDKIKIEKFFGKSLEQIIKLKKIPITLLLGEIDITENLVENNAEIPPLNKGYKNDNKQVTTIPFYDVVVTAGTQIQAELNAVTEPVEQIDAGDWFRDATGAMRVHGDSMQTKYSPGSIIAFKEVLDRELIIYGRDYVIETSEYRILKRVQKNSSKAHILACSYNESLDGSGNLIHAPFEVPLKKITRLFAVLGKVERDESSRIVYNKK